MDALVQTDRDVFRGEDAGSMRIALHGFHKRFNSCASEVSTSPAGRKAAVARLQIGSEAKDKCSRRLPEATEMADGDSAGDAVVHFAGEPPVPSVRLGYSHPPDGRLPVVPVFRSLGQPR